MILATSYYPEHWPEEQWPVDAKLMKKAGITRIRMGEFAWHKLEPRENMYDFEWLETAIELFGNHDIKTILCTPTPTYPAWLHKKYPDIHQIKSNGTIKEYGQRQDACKNHKGYINHSLGITAQVADHFGHNPNVVAWQIDNELGCHSTTRCYCTQCMLAFREWLRVKYKTIENINKAWGTSFWSQQYNGFDEIGLPWDTANREGKDGQNPGMVLDFYRFSSDVQVTYLKKQVKLVRRASPGRTITHNLMGGYNEINYFDLTEELDIVSWDNYPFLSSETQLPPVQFSHNNMRGLKKKNVWVMEQAAGAGGWGCFMPTPKPGQMRLWAYQAVAHGADMINFFRWRSCRFGREQYWHGILYHHGIPQRRYDEVKVIGEEFNRIKDELAGSTVKANAALLYDYEIDWTLEIQPHVESGFKNRELMYTFTSALSRLGITTDIVSPEDTFCGYDTLIVPTLHICTEKTVQNLEHFVAHGGRLILGPRSGVKNEDNSIVNDLLPGKLKNLVGAHVSEYDAVEKKKLLIKGTDGKRYTGGVIADILEPDTTAQSLFIYDSEFYSGSTAATINKYGKGTCIYLGCCFDKPDLIEVLKSCLDFNKPPSLPQQLEVVNREKEGSVYTFYLNHAATSLTVVPEHSGIDILNGKVVDKEIEIDGYGVMIVKKV